MSNLGEKVSYLKGLAEGLKVDASSSEGKLIVQMIDVLSEVTTQLDELQEAYQELNDYVECIDDDLEELELQCEGEDEDDEGFEFDDDDEPEHDIAGFTFVDDEDDGLEDESEPELLEDGAEGDCAMYFGCLCSECGGMFCVDADSADSERLLICPHCTAKVAAVPMDLDNLPMAKPAKDEPEET
jgi:DNA-directed RNA polymerase subunit delta